MKKKCKHCSHEFRARRKNHVYCCTSCKTLASYKRNNYKYVAGHYQKQQSTQPEVELATASNKIKSAITSLEERFEKMSTINVPSIASVALGSAAKDGVVYGAKKMFAPHTLPATKGDVETIKQEINNLKQLLNNNKGGFGVY